MPLLFLCFQQTRITVDVRVGVGVGVGVSFGLSVGIPIPIPIPICPCCDSQIAPGAVIGESRVFSAVIASNSILDIERCVWQHRTAQQKQKQQEKVVVAPDPTQQPKGTLDSASVANRRVCVVAPGSHSHGNCDWFDGIEIDKRSINAMKHPLLLLLLL
jgi:hypothetical protein